MMQRIFVLAVAIGAAFAAGAHARVRAEFETVTGKAQFERRSTIVPMCEDPRCPKPEPYWSLVLTQDGVKYELDQVFDRGSYVAPESIELVGVVIRPGSQVMLEGRVQVINEEYAFISEVTRADLLMDGPRQQHEGIEPGSQPLWVCRSSAEESPRLQVEVWSKGTAWPEGGFRLKIAAESPSEYRLLFDMQDVDFTVARHHVSYRGSNQLEEAELIIDQEDVIFRHAPASLRMTKVHTGPVYRVPIEILDELRCDRNLVP